MTEWRLPDIPIQVVSIDELLEDKMNRPADYERVSSLINQAIAASMETNPTQALLLLQQAADLCPHETTIWILMGDAYRDLGRSDYARHAYEIGAAYGDSAAMDRLNRFKARIVVDEVNELTKTDAPESIELIRRRLLIDEGSELHWAEYRDLAKKVQKLKSEGSSDLSWALLSKSLHAAMSRGAELLTIYSEQGNQLFKEGKYKNAMQTYLLAYLHSPDPPPKYVRTNLEKCFNRIERPGTANLEKLLSIARSTGRSSHGVKDLSGIESAMKYLFQDDQ